MANLIARQPTANAEASATQMNSVQGNSSSAVDAKDVSQIDASTAKGKDALAKKQEFDATLSQNVNVSDAAKKAAAEAIAQAKVEVKDTAAATAAATTAATTAVKATAAIQPANAQAVDSTVTKVTTQQEKNKKQVSDQAAALAQVKGSQQMPAALQVVFGVQTAKADPKAVATQKQVVQVQNQLQTPQTQKQGTDAQALVNGLHASQFVSNGVDQPNEIPGFALVQDINYQGDVQVAGQDKAGVSALNTTQATQKATAASPTLSTDDYLNLRNFSNGQAVGLKKTPSKLSLDTTQIGAPLNAPTASQLQVRDGQHIPLKTIDAPVTTGSMMKTVLSHDALHQMTGQLSAMNFAKQDGEIKIRLKPDHLGDLTMSIRNHGAQVAIRIQAHDPEAKQIIESSLNSLRDSLSQQNLTVTRLEVTQAPAAVQTMGQDGMNMQMDMGQFHQQGSDLGFQQQQQQESTANRNYWREEESNGPRLATPISAARTNVVRSSNQGLDLIA